jgi:hypothetical protein
MRHGRRMTAVGLLTGGLLVVGLAGPALADAGTVADAPTTTTTAAAPAAPQQAAGASLAKQAAAGTKAAKAKAAKEAAAAKAEQARVATLRRITDRVLGPAAAVPQACSTVVRPAAFEKCVTGVKAAADKAAAADDGSGSATEPSARTVADSLAGDEGAQGDTPACDPVTDPLQCLPAQCVPGPDEPKCDPPGICQGGDKDQADPTSCGHDNGGGNDDPGNECTTGDDCVNGICINGDHAPNDKTACEPPAQEQQCTPGAVGCGDDGQCIGTDNTPDDETTCEESTDPPGPTNPGNGGNHHPGGGSGPSAGGTDSSDGSGSEGTVPGAVAGTSARGASACGDSTECQSVQAVETTSSTTSGSSDGSGLGDTGASTMLRPMLVLGFGFLLAGVFLVRPRRVLARHKA